MRNFIITFALLVGTASCGGDSVSGACNVCPTSTNVDLAACAAQAASLGCASAEIVDVTDDACDVGQPPTTHQACVYSECDEALDCSQVAEF